MSGKVWNMTVKIVEYEWNSVEDDGESVEHEWKSVEDDGESVEHEQKVWMMTVNVCYISKKGVT